MTASNLTVRVSGYCECGCGQKTRVATINDRNKGWIKGQPIRFVNGHQLRSSKRGKDHWNWKGGRQKSSHGYIVLYQPDGGRKYEHVAIAERVLGRALKHFSIGHPDNEVVHHIDGNKSNNRRSNLLICTHAYHVALHAKLETSDDWPQFVTTNRMERMWAANRKAWADPERRARRIQSIREAKR